MSSTKLRRWLRLVPASLQCRICRRVALLVFLSIVAVEAAILVPSYRNYERDLLQRLEDTGHAAILAAFNLHGHARHRDLLILGQALTRMTGIRGGALYTADGALIGHFGEAPVATMAGLGAAEIGRWHRRDARRYEVAWPAGAGSLPVGVVARLDSGWIADELINFVWRIGGLVLLISVVVCGAAMLVLSRTVLGPMLDLRAALMAAGERPAESERHMLPVARRDELGDVVDAVNKLLFRVSRTFREELATMVAMVDEASDAILAYGRDGRLIYANYAALALCGREDLDQLVAEDLPRFFEPDGRAARTLPAMLADGVYAGEVTLSAAGGRTVPCLMNAATLTDDEGAVLRYFTSLRDISEIRDAREQLQRQNLELAAADRAKSEFLANMSHELRTPLNAIIGFSEIIAESARAGVPPDKFGEYADDINDAGMHLLRIINDILDLSKIEAGRMKLRCETVTLPEVAAASLTLIRDRAGAAGVDIRLDLPPTLPPLSADPVKLKQILLNLLSNAVKFTEAGVSVTLSARAEADGVVLQVADTGIGIAADDIPKAMAPFSQVDNALSRRFEGTGLGLPLSKALVDLHGGSLDLESAPGQGTIVRIWMPRDGAAGRAGDQALKSPGSSSRDAA